jgi:cobalt-zinc-cadmium efflux system protein
MLAEAIGGYLTNSLALLSDAGHMLADVASLVLALLALWFAARPATAKKTYGYYRMERFTESSRPRKLRVSKSR